jgi:hypothetical protein
MNETEIIRRQLATERMHAAQVANACTRVFGAVGGSTHAAFREASINYLVWVLSRFEQRDQLLAERIAHRVGIPEHTAATATFHALAALAARPGTSHQALILLETALAAPQEAAPAAWQAFAHYFNTTWYERREALENQLAQLRRLPEWRALCAIDADSILEERTRYAHVAAHLPAGVTLIGAPRP